MLCELRCAIGLVLSTLAWSCGGQSSPPPAVPATEAPSTAAQAPPDAEPVDDGFPLPAVRPVVALAALLPSNATGCAPGSRCIQVSSNGQPQAGDTSIAQCRGEFADFIVPANTIPAGYSGPWFTPNLIENAHSGIPA